MEARGIGQSVTRNRFRFLLLIVATMCLSSVFSNVITINFTINCMDPTKHHNQTDLKYSLHAYTSSQKTSIQWAVSVSSMLATFPFSYICTRFGAQHVFLASGIASALSTILIPFSADWGFVWLLLMRVFQGLAYACDFAVIGVVCTRWASLKDISMFLAMLTTFPAFSTVFTNLISGVICDSTFGWPMVHYVHGAICLVLFILWFILYTDNPDANKFISTQELSKIYEGKSEAHKKSTRRIPYLKICKNPVVWAIWLNAFTDLFASFYFILYNPTYNAKVLNVDFTNNGFASALETAIIIPLKLISGYASDKYNCVPERQKMWIYNSLCTLIPAVIFIVVTFLPTSVPWFTIIVFGISNASVGFNSGGYYRCCCLVTRQYGEFVIAFTQFIKCAIFFLAPLLVQIFVHDETRAADWFKIFYIMAVALIISNCVFCYFATDKPAKFTLDDDEHALNQPPNKTSTEITLDSDNFVKKM